MKDINKNKVASSLAYKFLEQSLAQGIMFIIAVVLARLLTPKEFGVIALTTIFLEISMRFIDSGLNASLIQKKDADEKDFSSVFLLSLAIAVVLYWVIFLAAPFIAGYFEEPQLKNILRVLSIMLIFGSAKLILDAVVIKKMQFKMMLYSSAIALTISGTVGIIMAYSGFGVWALVTQQLLNSALYSSILLIQTKWFPKPYFSLQRIKPLFKFGSKILISSLLDVTLKEIRGLIIGRMYTSSMLGFYNRGRKLPNQVVSAADGSIRAVMFATLAHFQEDIVKLKQILRRLNRLNVFVLFPMMLGMALIAEPMVKVILTDKWLPSVPYIRIFCFAYALTPIITNNLQVIKAIGRSDVVLKLSIIKKSIEAVLIIISLQYGVLYLALTVAIGNLISVVIWVYASKKLIGYSFSEFFADMARPLLLSVIMGVVVYGVGYLNVPTGALLFLQVITGIVCYVGMAKVLKDDSYCYIMDYVKTKLKK